MQSNGLKCNFLRPWKSQEASLPPKSIILCCHQNQPRGKEQLKILDFPTNSPRLSFQMSSRQLTIIKRKRNEQRKPSIKDEYLLVLQKFVQKRSLSVATPHGRDQKQTDKKPTKVLRKSNYQRNHKSGIQEPMTVKILTQYSAPQSTKDEPYFTSRKLSQCLPRRI